MLFQKSAPTVGRSALAAQAKSKKFWAVSSSTPSQTHPGFFVSTPQFTRHQQSQITPFFDDSRGAGNSDSYGIENPYLALTAGATCGAGIAHTLIFEEEAKEEHQSSSRGNVSLPNIAKSSPRSTLPLSPPHRTYRVNVYPTKAPSDSEVVMDVAEAIDQAGTATMMDGILMKMHRLHAAGSHNAVLATFETMEATQQDLPIDAYNLVLDTLVQTSDVATQLQAYEGMLARGIIPNTTTYSILLNSLVDAAEELASKRTELKPLLGPGNQSLESVAEVYEGLAAEEHLVLAQHILQAIIASRSVAADGIDAKLQHCINRVVEACLDAHVELPSSLLQAANCHADSLIRIQPSIAQAATQFSALSPEEQQSEGAQGAMLDSYFRFRQPQGAIAFYSGCGAPAYLLKPLISGFAASGYVATAYRWSKKNEANNDVVSAALAAIPLEIASNALPSATRMFYQLIGGGGSGSAGSRDGSSKNDTTGRCSFIRLCVAADHLKALLMAVRESKLVNCGWDATTISEVASYLAKAEPLLAADICNWQVSMLRSAQDAKCLKSYIVEEIVSNTVAALKNHNQLSLDAALRLLEVVSVCTSSRREVLSIIASSRLKVPHEVARLMDSHRIASVTSTLAGLMNNKINRLTQEELDEVKLALPLLVQDCILLKSEFAPENALAIKEALMSFCPRSDVLSEFSERYADATASAANNSSRNNKEASVLIQRYALAPNGLDHALRILDDELRLGRQVSGPAVDAILSACVSHNATDLIAPLYSRLPKTQSTLNALAIVAARINDFDLSAQCCRDLVDQLGVYPTAATYVELLKAYRSHPDTVLQLYNEAKLEAKLELDAEAYNHVLQSLAQALKKKELGECLREMHSKQFPILPQTYGPLLSMYVRLDEGYKALEILKSMSDVTKSLLEVKVFNHIMNYFVHKNPDRNAALEVFVELRNTGTLATPFTYRLLMEAYLLKNSSEGPNVDNADRVLTLMRRDGAPITTQCFATLLRARGVICKDFDSARDFYRGLVKSSRVLPDKGIFKALMESYIINGKQAESELVFDEMKRYHVPIDDDIASMAVPRS